MSYWRKLFIVVLLVLSLPVQSYAVVLMKCAAASIEALHGSTPHVEQVMSEHHHEMRTMVAASGEHRGHYEGGNSHARLHACSTCVSCCFGAGLPAVPIVAAPLVDTLISTRLQPSAVVVSFLTDGIERPPRGFLV